MKLQYFVNNFSENKTRYNPNIYTDFADDAHHFTTKNEH